MVLYAITNVLNGKQYIGIAVDPTRRFREHVSGHGSTLVYQASQKYGLENLHFDIWFEDSEEWVKVMERRTILALNTVAPHGYNLTLGGEGTVGWHPTAETRRKMSLAHTGKTLGPHTEATKRKISDAHRGRAPHDAFVELVNSQKRSRHPCSKPVAINGVRFGCILDAADALGVHRESIARACRKAGSRDITYTPRRKSRPSATTSQDG